MVGSSIGSSLGIGDDKLEGSPMGEKLFGSECITKVDTSVVSSDGKVFFCRNLQRGLDMARWRVLHWERSHLVKNPELR